MTAITDNLSRPLIVGLHNPLSTRPADALYPYPRTSTGGRLVAMVKLSEPDFTEEDFLDTFDRANLWRGHAMPTGRGAARALCDEGVRILSVAMGREHVVLLGARVWDAVTGRKLVDWFESVTLNRMTTFHRLPHPSGLNLVYNDEAHRRRSGEVLLKAAGRR